MAPSDRPPLSFAPISAWRVRCPHCGGILDEFGYHDRGRPWVANWVERVEDMTLYLDHGEMVLTAGACPHCGSHLGAFEVGQWSGVRLPSDRVHGDGLLRLERATLGAGFSIWCRATGVIGGRLIYRHRFVPVTEETLPDAWARLLRIVPLLPSPDQDELFAMDMAAAGTG